MIRALAARSHRLLTDRSNALLGGDPAALLLVPSGTCLLHYAHDHFV